MWSPPRDDPNPWEVPNQGSDGGEDRAVRTHGHAVVPQFIQTVEEDPAPDGETVRGWCSGYLPLIENA
jgi:hypothetical protein